MKKFFSISVTLALCLCFYLASGQRTPPGALAADTRKTAFLIRFGVDGKADVDWSGSVEPMPARLMGWQFDANEQIEGASWKCSTREENYWDTPYERRLQPTSNRDKVTTKGIVVEFDASAG